MVSRTEKEKAMVPNEVDHQIQACSSAEIEEWDVEMEVQFFIALTSHKPAGWFSKHFELACIWEKMTQALKKDLNVEDIWNHLNKYYNGTSLDNALPPPYFTRNVPFSILESEYGALMRQKCKDILVGEETGDIGSPSPKISTPRSITKGSSKDNTPKAPTTAVVTRKDSVTALATKSRKESGSSHASTDTPSNKSEKEYDRRRDSRDSNASGTKDTSTRKSMSQKDKNKPKVASPATWESPLLLVDEDSGRRGRRRANTSTPPATTPAKRRRT